MKLVIGGYAQGKLRYVLQGHGTEKCRVWDGEIPERVCKQGEIVVMNHFHNWVRNSILNDECPEEKINTILERYPDCIIISDEVGNGIVPVETLEREYRERTGRILVELAQRAEEVVRVICGIGQKIK